MKLTVLLTFALLGATVAARADFSYTTTHRTTGGMVAAMAGGGNQAPAKYYFKGQKMKTENGDTATILDFDAQTITTVNNRLKTVSVRGFNDLAAATKQGNVTAKIEVKETGQKKTINGYNASELILTMDIDSPQTQQMGKMQMEKMQIEMDMWLSPDVPGAGQLRSFYQKNMAKFPWAALAGNGNQAMQSGLADLQRKIAEMNGVQVLQVVKVKAAGGAAAAPAMPQMSAAQSAQMKEAMAKLEAMQKQGGPQAAAAAQAMARMGGMAAMAGGAPAGGASNSMIEMTMESSDFSTSSIPDSVFAIPAGYQKVDVK